MLPSNDGGVEEDGSDRFSWFLKYVSTAGDIDTLGGGVGGTGEVNCRLNALTSAHGSPFEGIISEGNELREFLLPNEPVDDLFDREGCSTLLLSLLVLLLRLSSSDEAS